MSDWKLISTANPSGAANVSFTDLTGYKIFKFVFIDVNPATDFAIFQFQVNASGQTGYNETITSTFFHAHQKEDGTDATLQYVAAADQAQGTGYQYLVNDTGTGSGADESNAGELFLYNPASTVYVKHFYSRTQNCMPRATPYDWAADGYAAGYINVTAAITSIDFKMSSGNFDGTIKQYGLVAG